MKKWFSPWLAVVAIVMLGLVIGSNESNAAPSLTPQPLQDTKYVASCKICNETHTPLLKPRLIKSAPSKGSYHMETPEGAALYNAAMTQWLKDEAKFVADTKAYLAARAAYDTWLAHRNSHVKP